MILDLAMILSDTKQATKEKIDKLGFIKIKSVYQRTLSRK